jgi:uncharacterized protein (DUF58 family)
LGFGLDGLENSRNRTVNVYPDLLALRSLTIRLALQTSGALKQRRKFGIGTEFAELREYGGEAMILGD